MAKSPRYRALVRELRQLRREFLPRKFSATGSYSARTHAHARAYRVLAHAEFESYFEDRGEELALAAKQQWDGTRGVSRVLVNLLAFSGLQMPLPPDQLTVPTKKPAGSILAPEADLDDRIKKAMNVYVHGLGKNHGVKEGNLLSIFLPVGVNPSDFDPIWLGSITSYGTDRGVFAHTSRSKLSTPPDPASELASVAAILAGCGTLDEVLNQLLV